MRGIPLTLIDIFKGMEQKRAEATLPDEKWSLSVSYLEVYNEKIRDLFEPSGVNLPVQEDPKAGIVGVGGLAKRPATSSQEVMELLRYGNTNRRTHATDANATSSRSHAVLQIIMKQSWSNSKGTPPPPLASRVRRWGAARAVPASAGASPPSTSRATSTASTRTAA